MPLEEEVKIARKEIVTDGYEMSVGEIINLYENKEIQISPNFQRLYRWEPSSKTRFIESLLLGIPTPPIFVYQNDDGVWELIDGLQRLSTIFQFVGKLQGQTELLILEGTRFLPDLANKSWEKTDRSEGIGKALQLDIKRTRIRVEILKKDSDPTAKYELFQRLNTGGASLSEQEVRNCIALMINKDFHEWLESCSASGSFLTTIDQTEYALKQQSANELALRFFSFRNVPYKNNLDVHEYLDFALLEMAGSPNFDTAREKEIFDKTFNFIFTALGDKAFKRWDGSNFAGKFLMSVFEVFATGVSQNIDAIERLEPETRKNFLISKAKDLWGNTVFLENTGAGIRGTTRLAKLLPLAKDYIRP